MGLFSKKKLYKVKWTYGYGVHTDIVAARDPAQAWKKVKKEHWALSLVELEEIKWQR